MEVPASVDFDVSELHLGDSAHLSQVALPEGVTLLDDGDTVFATVTQPTREVEPEPEEGAEGEEGVEGEAAEGDEPTAEGDGEPRPTRPSPRSERMRLWPRRHGTSYDLLVAGLGNPGREYARNRHNVGWLVVDELARRHDGSWQGEVQRQARRDPHRRAQGRAAEARDVHERVRAAPCRRR